MSTRLIARVVLTASATLGAAATAAPPAAQEPLERAFAAVDEAGIRADLAFLAAPELAGRGTPSAGLEIAARFVEARVRRLGLQPGTRDGYQHRFELAGRAVDVEASSIVARGAGGERAFELGGDAFLRGFGDLATASLEGPVIAVGDGGRAALASAGDLAGAWALLFETGRGTAGAIRRTLEAGAAGVLVTPGEAYARAPYAERFARTTERLTELRFQSPLGAPPDDGASPPTLLLTREAGGALLALAGAQAAPPVGTRLAVTFAERRVVRRVTATAPNVAALLPGSDPERAGEVLVLCAHLDHLGTGRDGVIYPGADDNGSGSVGLLALAEAAVARGGYGRSLLFLWVAGEESGLWGSAIWCRDPRLPAGYAPRAALNLDMIGRDAPATLWVTPTSDHAAFNPLAALGPELAATEGFDDIVSQDGYWSASDHYSFASELRVPVLYLSSGEHDDYHQPTDTPDRVDVDKLARIVRLTLRILERSDALALEPVESVGGRRR